MIIQGNFRDLYTFFFIDRINSTEEEVSRQATRYIEKHMSKLATKYEILGTRFHYDFDADMYKMNIRFIADKADLLSEVHDGIF